MGSKELKTRDQIDKKYKWNIEAMISDESTIEKDLSDLKQKALEYNEKYAGHLADSADTLLNAFIEKDELSRKLEKIYVYVRMRRDENNADSKYQAMTDMTMAVIAAVSASLSFFTPELLASDEAVIRGYMDECKGLDTYRFVIDDAFREKEHILSEKE